VNEVFEFARFKAQLALVIGQIGSVVDSRLAIANNDTIEHVCQELQRQTALVHVVRVQARKNGDHELNGVHLSLIAFFVKAVVFDNLSSYTRQAAENCRVAMWLYDALQALVYSVNEWR
jgi:hypothetical protein